MLEKYRYYKGLRIPIYITRSDSDGLVGTYKISAFVGLIILYLVQINMVFWGTAGVAYSVKLIADLF